MSTKPLLLVASLTSVVLAAACDESSTPGTSPGTSSYSVGGSVSGLSPSATLVLQNNGADDLTVTSDGPFAFATRLEDGAAYAVGVASQPIGQTCTIDSGSGTIAGAGVTSVSVSCSVDTYDVGGTVSGLVGTLVLANNGTDELTVTGDGPFAFASQVAFGADYEVTIASQPATVVCEVVNGTGTVAAGGVTDISVTCTPSYSVGGTVTGLAGTLVLDNNGVEEISLTGDGPFAFDGRLTEGEEYVVTIASQPATATCSLANASGTIGTSDVTDISVTCTPSTYSVSGTVQGLQDTIVLQNNGADDLTLDVDGDFAFPTPVASGSTFEVTVATQPAGQICIVLHGAGEFGGADVIDVSVRCDTRKAFLTSASGTADLGSWADAGGQTGLAAGDAICQAHADAVGLTGTFVAWLSDSADDAYCRVHGLTGTVASSCGGALDPASPAGPWVRTDGTPFADTIDVVVANQTTLTPARYYEDGTMTELHFSYLTATKADGTLSNELGTGSCGDWTNATEGSATVGYTQATGSQWTTGRTSLCSSGGRLVCMEVGSGAPVAGFSHLGKRVFVTSERGTGDLSSWTSAGGETGVAAADTVCRTLAAAAGLENAGNFEAWLATSTASAAERLTTDGPWVRIDGIKVADSKDDLLDGRPFAPINVDESGAYTSNWAWTGADQAGASSGEDCGGWTGDVGYGTSGRTSDTAYWSSGGSSSCTMSRQLYCFEDEP